MLPDAKITLLSAPPFPKALPEKPVEAVKTAGLLNAIEFKSHPINLCADSENVILPLIDATALFATKRLQTANPLIFN